VTRDVFPICDDLKDDDVFAPSTPVHRWAPHLSRPLPNLPQPSSLLMMALISLYVIRFPSPHPKYLIVSSQSEKITDAVGVDLEPIGANLLAKALEGKSVKELLSNVGSGGGAPAVGAPAEAPAEEKRRRKRRNQMRTRYVFALLCFSMPVEC
jgi:large subunit ribosomal protein LP1